MERTRRAKGIETGETQALLKLLFFSSSFRHLVGEPPKVASEKNKSMET